MSVSIRTRPAGRDPVVRAHRRATLLRGTLIVAILVAVIGGGSWLMFSSSVFAVLGVTVDGATASVAGEVRAAVDETLGQRRLGFLRPARNILLLNTGAVAASLVSAFPNLEGVSVVKEYPHTVRITVSEREPMGAWCRGETCRYFDRSGARWGSAVPSRGPLLLLVRDERSDDRWDDRLFAGMRTAVSGLPDLGLRPIVVTFPDAAPGDMRISVAAGYEVIMDALGDVADQLATLGVLIADRAGDPAFRPSYVDVRTLGRVYYR